MDTIKDTEKKVFADTENLLKELSVFHKNNLDEFSKHLISASDLEKQISEFNKDKKRFEFDKKILEEELKEKDFEQLTEKTKELERLQRKFSAIEEENAQLKQTFEALESAFGSMNSQEILNQNSFLKEELKTLREELNERPEQYELDGKQAKIEELQAKVTGYQEKINERELLELKRIINNNDSYVIEINGYKNQIESAKVREASLQKTNDDLLEAINQLKGESLKKTDAFEFAKKCYNDKNNLGRKYLDNNTKQPADLKTLVTYVQQWMAFKSDKPFYYDLNTIRIFLAGMHMSPISILQGISGTGKTSLPREFAKALISDSHYINKENNNDNAPYRICAIQSGWRDNMDLMGYYNSFEHKYKETEFFKALYVANLPKYENTLFLIILDEMNLSRPEHYFADFLSLLEQSPSERYISLTNTPTEVLPNLIKEGKLKIPENVRFIGTANHDETTLEFAPKTYDRSNVMELPKNHPNNIKNNNIESKYNITYSWLKSQFKSAEKMNESYYTKFINFIDSEKIQDLLTKKGIGVGNRLEYQAEKFIGVFMASGSENEKEKSLATAADHLITSRLFRTLKNRYDIDETNLESFKDEYVKLFEKTFKQEPNFAIDLLESEINKK